MKGRRDPLSDLSTGLAALVKEMACPNRYQKSSLRAYSTSEQTIGNVVFSTIAYQSGCSIKAAAGTSNIYLKSPGLYYITLDIDLTNSTANTETTVQLYQDGVALAGAAATGTIVAIGDLLPTTISAVVPVRPHCPCMEGSVITAQLSGTTAGATNVNINVIKLA